MKRTDPFLLADIEVFDTAIRDIPPLRQQIHDILYAIDPDMIDGDESKRRSR